MRTERCFGLLLSLALSACGGGQVSPAAPAAEAPATGSGVDAGTVATPPTGRDSGSSGSSAGAASPGPGGTAEPDIDAGRLGPRAHDPGRGPADIRAIVVAHRDEARACYDQSLSAHPGIEGDLMIHWVIDPKGVVSQVASDAARSQILEPSLVACIAEILMKLQFAPSQRGFETKAFYPFNFHPRHPPRAAAP
jgi:hypothetical protein